MKADAIQATPRDVAEWMAAEIEEDGILLQQAAAHAIRERFGAEFVCVDAHGDLGIARRVLYQFRKITGDRVVWVAVQGDWLLGYWRMRGSGDLEGRTQFYY